jgi:hypothetical protein
MASKEFVVKGERKEEGEELPRGLRFAAEITLEQSIIN